MICRIHPLQGLVRFPGNSLQFFLTHLAKTGDFPLNDKLSHDLAPCSFLYRYLKQAYSTTPVARDITRGVPTDKIYYIVLFHNLTGNIKVKTIMIAQKYCDIS